MIHTSADLGRAVEWLAVRDKSLAGIVERHGLPPVWPREPGFATLLHIILEQQVSLASARAAFDRLCHAIGPPAPRAFLTLGEVELKTIGFSRQKTRYGRELAQEIVAGRLDLEQLGSKGDDDVRVALTRLPGIGNWTADIDLLLALGRPDAFAPTDLALQIAVQRLRKLPARPTPVECAVIAENWRPYRAGAARLLWHAYLSEKAAKAASAIN